MTDDGADNFSHDGHLLFGPLHLVAVNRLAEVVVTQADDMHLGNSLFISVEHLPL